MIPPRECHCCECQGIMCFMDHPGHAHNGSCKQCPREWDWIDRKIYHDNGHVWPGFAGEPDGNDFGGSDF